MNLIFWHGRHTRSPAAQQRFAAPFISGRIFAALSSSRLPILGLSARGTPPFAPFADVQVRSLHCALRAKPARGNRPPGMVQPPALKKTDRNVIRAWCARCSPKPHVAMHFPYWKWPPMAISTPTKCCRLHVHAHPSHLRASQCACGRCTAKCRPRPQGSGGRYSGRSRPTTASFSRWRPPPFLLSVILIKLPIFGHPCPTVFW